MSTATSPKTHQTQPQPVRTRRPPRPAPARTRTIAPARPDAKATQQRRRALLDLATAWITTATSLGFMAVAILANADAYASGVPASLTFWIIFPSFLAGVFGTAIHLITRRMRR